MKRIQNSDGNEPHFSDVNCSETKMRQTEVQYNTRGQNKTVNSLNSLEKDDLLENIHTVWRKRNTRTDHKTTVYCYKSTL